MLEQALEFTKNIKMTMCSEFGILYALIAKFEHKNNNQEERKNANQCERNLILGGVTMKYQGITITPRKNTKTWYARYRLNGKQISVSAKTQKECYIKLKQALKLKGRIKHQTQQNKNSNCITLQEWFLKWLKLYKQNVKQNTLRDFNYSFNYLKRLHNKPLDTITPIEINEILSDIKFERRKQIVWELLHSLYEKAILNEITTKNPTNAIEKPKHKKTNGQAFTNEDELKLEKLLVEKELDIYLIGLYQGMRRGELLALTIEDIDFINKTIRINKGLNESNQLDTTKNEYSNRVVPLFDKTAKILAKYKNTSGRLFKMAYNTCGKNFQTLIKSNFNKHYTMHSLRHTFITKCKEKNIPEHIIQSWVGHEIGSSVTREVYTHLRDNAELENIKKMNQN